MPRFARDWRRPARGARRSFGGAWLRRRRWRFCGRRGFINHGDTEGTEDRLALMRTRLAFFACLFIAGSAMSGVVDDLDDVSKWTAAPSDGVSLALVPDHGAMRMDFDFRGHGGWAAARRAVNIALPDNYRFAF